MLASCFVSLVPSEVQCLLHSLDNFLKELLTTTLKCDIFCVTFLKIMKVTFYSLVVFNFTIKVWYLCVQVQCGISNINNTTATHDGDLKGYYFRIVYVFTIAVTRNFLKYEDEKHSSSDLTTLYIFSANALDISSCGMNWSSVTMATTVSLHRTSVKTSVKI